VAAFLGAHPTVTLRVYGHQTYPTLDFLDHFDRVDRVHLDIFELQDVSGVRFLKPDLVALGLGATRKRFSLHALTRFTALEALWLDGHDTDFEVVAQLTSLGRLTLRSITVPNLQALRTLHALEHLELKLGGTQDLAHLPDIGRLRYFEAYLVRGLSDLEPVAGVLSLRFLFLQALKGVTSLPSFATLPELRRVHLETMKGLGDLAPVAAAPALEELVALDMGSMAPDAFGPFVGHPSLRAVRIRLGSERSNAAVQRLLPLPDAGYVKPDLPPLE
jgi:hypothetical protein